MSKLTVTLDHEDLINLAEFVYRKNPNSKITQGSIEYCIYDFLRTKKNTDFFKEEEERELEEYEEYERSHK